MAKKTDNRSEKSNGASAFSVLAVSTAVVLIAAAALLYLQSGRAASPELAALSQEVNRHADALMANREAAGTIRSAAASVNERMPEMLTASDALLEAGGSTQFIQQFQQR
ncbi:MAG TPA: hypothetical protein VHG33_10470, partial [Woeseiaceae bacterium]|nr:hypothetical protein [Woeseiaceae bacterium]